MKKSGAKTGLFLIELIISLLLFAFCAAICIQIFVGARFRTNDSTALSKSVFLASSAAECYKKTGGDLRETSALLNIPGAVLSGDTLTAVYNGDWEPVGGSGGPYFFTLTDSPGNTASISISYSGIRGEREIFALTAKAVDFDA
jgi:type II secretory pathway pseudopilin PulG